MWVDRIDPMTETTRQDDPERFLTIVELAARFQISRSTAYRMKKEQAWPSHRFGTEIRFSPADIEAISAMNEEPPPGKRPRSTRIGSEAARRRAHNYNIRHGLVGQKYTGPER